MSQSSETDTPSSQSRSWLSRWLCDGKRRWWLLGLPVAAVVLLFLGAGAGLAFVGFVEYSNTESFCISCHEMRDNAYAEFRESVHYKTASGAGPVCADCHVPKPWVAKMRRKIQASLKEVPGHFLGRIDTQEKYDAHRREMAESVWASMRANDSRECRSCHRPERMDLEAQSRFARRKHSAEWRERSGDTCIDCHQGVAHKLPEVALD